MNVYEALLDYCYRGKHDLFGEKPVSVPSCPPQIPRERNYN